MSVAKLIRLVFWSECETECIMPAPSIPIESQRECDSKDLRYSCEGVDFVVFLDRVGFKCDFKITVAYDEK